jgi:hypothetical protein
MSDLDALWEKVLENWDDEKRHAAALQFALTTEQLADLAGRYRTLENDEKKGTLAKKKIDAIVASAIAMLQSMKTPPPPKSNKVLTFAAAMLAAVVFSYLAWMLAHARH